jgi:hypothetical protein
VVAYLLIWPTGIKRICRTSGIFLSEVMPWPRSWLETGVANEQVAALLTAAPDVAAAKDVVEAAAATLKNLRDDIRGRNGTTAHGG